MADPDVDAILADLKESGVHLGPGTQGWLDSDDLAALTAATREGVPVHVVLVDPPESGGGIHYGDDLLARVHDAGGPDGLYVGINNVWLRPDDGEEPGNPTLPSGEELNLALQQWGDVSGAAGGEDVTDDVNLVLSYGNGEGASYPLGEGLLRVVESLRDGTFAELAAEGHEGLNAAVAESRQEYQDTQSSSGFFGGDPDGVGAGDVVVGLLLLVALAGAAVALRRRRRGKVRAQQTFVLPESVLDRVRQAGDVQLERRAHEDVLALGEAIDAAEMSGSGSDAWAAALDHYEAAGRLLPTAGTSDPAVDPLDAAGAVVLAGRGREALAAARRGRAFTPTTPCFLNPLHGRAEHDRTLEHGDRSVRAPVCAACRRDLEAGRRPDILDVVVRGTPRHYFETDREPWASTGFGALEPDLVALLQRGPR